VCGFIRCVVGMNFFCVSASKHGPDQPARLSSLPVVVPSEWFARPFGTAPPRLVTPLFRSRLNHFRFSLLHVPLPVPSRCIRRDSGMSISCSDIIAKWTTPSSLEDAISSPNPSTLPSDLQDFLPGSAFRNDFPYHRPPTTGNPGATWNFSFNFLQRSR
jgi:hypothetical protein